MDLTIYSTRKLRLFVGACYGGAVGRIIMDFADDYDGLIAEAKLRRLGFIVDVPIGTRAGILIQAEWVMCKLNTQRWQDEILTRTWRPKVNAEIVKFAETMYQQNDFSGIQPLYDLLEAHSPHNSIARNHCMQPNHVRGCWLIDAIRGIE